MNLRGKIYVAGHRGLIGSAFCRGLAIRGVNDIVVRTHAELDLCDQAATRAFFQAEKPEYVILAAARVGGIAANDAYSADFTRENLQIQTNVIDSACRNGCKKLLFLGSACMYPKLCPQPIREESLMTGPLEPTNEGYAVAKIAGLTMCKNYRKQYGFDAISVMPANLYGPGDNFHPENSHVIPAMLRRFHEAKNSGAEEAVIWGAGSAMREFVHVDDAVDASLFLMKNYSDVRHVNIGSGFELSMYDLARTIADTVGFGGTLRTDPSKPDGMPRRILDSSFLAGMGWRPSINFSEGLRETYRWYLEHEAAG